MIAEKESPGFIRGENVNAIWMGLYPIYSEQKYLQKLPRWIPRWFDHAHSENIAAGLALAESLAAAKTDEDRVTFLTIPVKNALQHAGGITVDEPTAKLIAKNIVRTWQGQNPDAIHHYHLHRYHTAGPLSLW